MEIMSVYFRRKYVIFCAIWYHFYKVKNVKNTHGGVARLVKLQAKACSFTKSSTLPGVFFLFFQLYKSRKASLIQSSFAYRVLPRIFALEPHFEPLKHCIETLRKDVKFSKIFERSFYLIKCGSKWVKLTIWLVTSQLTFTCLKASIKTLEKGVKYIQS